MSGTPFTDAVAEIGRLRHALQQIVDRSHRSQNEYEPLHFPTEASKNWHDGFHTATAHWSLIAAEALDPVEYAEHAERWTAASHASDREWFELTGNCGACGMPAAWCQCTPEHPCGCGPHEVLPWPRTCWLCGGTGKHEKREPKVATP